MGLDRLAKGASSLSLAEITARLADAGIDALLVMVDNAFVMPGSPLPASWTDARFKSAAGTLTLVRRGPDAAVVVWGNADPELRDMQAKMAAALE
jgi:hypothetical protein